MNLSYTVELIIVGPAKSCVKLKTSLEFHSEVIMAKLSINGEKQLLDVEADMPLLWVLRDELGLTGTKFGCGVAKRRENSAAGIVAGSRFRAASI